MPEIVDLNAAIAKLRESSAALDAGAKHIGELKAKVEEMEKKLEPMEAENQKLVAEIGLKNKQVSDTKERLDTLEKQLHRIPNGSEEAAARKMQMKTMEKFLVGLSSMTDEERMLMPSVNMSNELRAHLASQVQEGKSLRTDIDPSGGFLAPPEYILEINKKITLVSPIRQYAKVRPVSAPEARSFRRDTLVTSYWPGEAQTFTPSQSIYGRDDILAHSLIGEVQITTKDLWSSAFNMESEINADLAEEFARNESQKFVVGTGKGQPEGFMNNPNVEVSNSGIANDIAFDNFHTLYGLIKTGYNPIYGGNRHTIARIRKMKDGVGRYLWEAGNVAAKIPNTINGDPYIEIPHMDDIGSNKYPIVYGDFSKGYLIVDGLQIIVIRNPFRTSGYVIFTAERFVGGKVIMPEAIKLLKCSA